MKYGNGLLGAVNGMRPDGKIDKTSMQSEEMWIGVTASLASLMIFEVIIKQIHYFRLPKEPAFITGDRLFFRYK